MTEPAASPGAIDGIPLTAKPLCDLAPPRFKTPGEERLHRKQRLAGALRAIDFDPEQLMLVFKETAWENWSFAGGRQLHA
jgi:hypothetical protein